MGTVDQRASKGICTRSSVFFRWRALIGGIVIGSLVSLSSLAEEVATEDPVTAMQETETASSDSQRQFIEGLLKQALDYQNKGDYPSAFEQLKRARDEAQAVEDASVRLAIGLQLSDLYLAAGERTAAEGLAVQVLEEAAALEESDASLLGLAAALNNWGNIMTIYDEYDEALEAYDAAYILGEDLSNPQVILRALLNMIKAALATEDIELALDAASFALKSAAELTENPENIWLVLGLAIEVSNLSQYTDDTAFSQFAWSAFVKADTFGKENNDTRLRSYASGYLGALYAAGKNYESAFRATRRALFFAQQGAHSEILYRWQWQLGNLFKAVGDTEKAVATYAEALMTLQPIRGQLLVGRRGSDFFNRHVKQVYYELAEIYLEEAESAPDPGTEQTLLRQARSVIEQMKIAEVENLFQDECVAALRSKARSLDDVTAGAAVVYPIPLKDRLEILVTLPGKGIHRATASVGKKSFEATVREFRQLLQTRTSRSYLRPAQEIYDWMIRPLEEKLQQSEIDTLIVVPEGVLSLIPFAALHDGERFLIESYAIATTPGLQLTDPQPVSRENFDGLLVGLSDAVQGYSALPNVPQELESIYGILENRQLFLNQNYSAENLTTEMEGSAYRVLHMATHGEFSSSPEDTYLLTYNDKLHLDKLERLIKLSRFRDKPLELLTLSACRTAVGDERAALGLAGVAVKSGARSALATLWFVDDEATRLGLTEFYKQFYQNPDLSKAQALQKAQVSLIHQVRYQHPAYWAPFLLIGNWL